MKKFCLLSLIAALALGSAPVLAGQDPVVVGATPNNDKGDPFRNAMIKLNKNDNELYGTLGSVNSTLSSIRNTMPVIDASGKVRFPSGPFLGTYQDGKFISQPDALQIQGPGSTGDVSRMSVAPSAAASAGSLAKLFSDLGSGRMTIDVNGQMSGVSALNTGVLAIGGNKPDGTYVVIGSSNTAVDPHIGFRSSGRAGPDVVLGATGGTGNSDGTFLIQGTKTNLVGGVLNIIPPPGTKGFNMQPGSELTTTTAGPYTFGTIFQSINAEITGSYDSSQQTLCACVTGFQSTLFLGPKYKGGEATGAAFSVVSYGGTPDPTNISDMIGVGSGVSQGYNGLSRLYGTHSGILLDTNGKTPGIYGMETELTVNNAAGTPYRAGFMALNTGPQKATVMDAAFAVSCSIPGGCWKHAIGLFTNDATWPNVSPTQNPLDATGDIIGTERAFTIAHVLNLPTITVTGNILNFNAVTLSGTGVMVNSGSRYYGPAPTAPANQVAYGGQLTTDTTKCGSLSGSAGCVLVSVSGTTRYYPYW
jgi:hypothetical protein